MEFKIEKNIPLNDRRSLIIKHPFNEMSIGDSFIIGDYSSKNMQKFSNRARYWARRKKNGYVFSTRKTDDNKIRIWRIK